MNDRWLNPLSWDFTWITPPKHQRAALELAKKVALDEFPVKDAAIWIFHAAHSWKFHYLECWVDNPPDVLVDAIPEVSELCYRICSVLKEGYARGEWWPSRGMLTQPEMIRFVKLCRLLPNQIGRTVPDGLAILCKVLYGKDCGV